MQHILPCCLFVTLLSLHMLFVAITTSYLNKKEYTKCQRKLNGK